MFPEIVDDSVLVFHTAPIIGVAMVFDLPGAVDFFRHGVIKVAVKQQDIVFLKTLPTELGGDIFLCPLRFRKYDDLLRDSVLLLEL